MHVSQRSFRNLMLFTAPPAIVAALVWLAQTPLQPFHGFVLIPSAVLLVLAAASWLDAKLAAPESAELDLVCGDAENVAQPMIEIRSCCRTAA
jgi:hypothetical protein